MDRLIHQLILIEEDAEKIIEQADEQKKVLSAEYEQKKIDYEKSIDQKTADELTRLSKKLAEKREKDIHALHMQTQQTIVALNTEYNEHGKEIAADIMQRVLDA